MPQTQWTGGAAQCIQHVDILAYFYLIEKVFFIFIFWASRPDPNPVALHARLEDPIDLHPGPLEVRWGSLRQIPPAKHLCLGALEAQ